MSLDERSARRSSNWTQIVIIAALVLGAFLLWQHLDRKRQQEAVLGAMVSAFQKQNSLNVFRAQVPVFVRSVEDGWLGLDREQFGVVPASVDYRLDLSQMRESDFDWDEGRQVMTITLPPVTPTEPSLDARRAQLVNRGVLMSPDTGLRLMRKNMGVARTKALAEARNPQLLELARSAAREMIARNYAMPLRAAGFTDATVEAHFATDGTRDGERITGSLSYEEAIRQGRQRRAAEGKK